MDVKLDSSRSYAYVTTPHGKEHVVDLSYSPVDSNDSSSTPGSFYGDFDISTDGVYLIKTFFEGITPLGQTFQRSTDQVLRVLHSEAKLQSKATSHVKGDYLKINLIVDRKEHNTHDIIAYAQVWGKNSSGENDVPIAWISGISEAVKADSLSHFSLLLHLDWISLANATLPLSLRMVEIREKEVLATLDKMEKIDLQFRGHLPDSVSARSFLDSIPISDEMINGPRPEHLRVKRSESNGKKILVHGYCSDALAWPADDFTDYIYFSDPNANRKIDEFARLVMDFANSSDVDSYSIIAHSQGGLVGLHIATYYWSGLDVATGGFLLQSVGSPYHGTTMAGTVASVGWVFGVGCGANDDLTPDGAEAWLAGIPQAKQELVHYYTTVGDPYCSQASDWAGLATPNDGVVSEQYGLLQYGNYEGNYDGWCHTSAMDFPFQCSDQERNAIINQNAAL